MKIAALLVVEKWKQRRAGCERDVPRSILASYSSNGWTSGFRPLGAFFSNSILAVRQAIVAIAPAAPNMSPCSCACELHVLRRFARPSVNPSLLLIFLCRNAAARGWRTMKSARAAACVLRTALTASPWTLPSGPPRPPPPQLQLRTFRTTSLAPKAGSDCPLPAKLCLPDGRVLRKPEVRVGQGAVPQYCHNAAQYMPRQDNWTPSVPRFE